MPIEAKIILDSINNSGNRLTTYVLTYPRFIHAEVLTHRLLSRNSSSSRAIPTKKMREAILADPAMPIWWGKNEPGMKAREELEPEVIQGVQQHWLNAMRQAAYFHQIMEGRGVHKQIANRILEPWMHITVICSATEFENFFLLRCHPDAQPEFQALASKMKAAYEESSPKKRGDGAWHIPFIKEEDTQWAKERSARTGEKVSEILLRISVGRCARVSYLTHEGVRDPEEDIKLHDKLLRDNPPHMSPFEHQAFADTTPARTANFVGWVQYRKTIINEHAGKEIR